MAIIVRMPKMGLTMTEGKITKWFKKEGEEIKKGEVFFEVTTDKITNEVVSEVSGIVLKIFVNEDDSAPIKEPVAIVGKSGEDITHLLDSTKILDKVEEKKHKAINESKEETTDSFIKATPWARKLAKERGIELSKIVPTGPNGRVVGNDIDKYYELSGGTKTSPMALKTADNLGVDISKLKTTGRVMKKDVISFYENSKIEELANPHDERIPMTQMRKVISERMSSSWNTSPAVTYEARVDVTKLKELKKDLKSFFNVTYTDLIVKILSKVLLKHKALNSSIEDNEIIYRNYVNMGVAVSIDNGLLVPVVKYSHIKSLQEISKEIKELAEKARNNELNSEDVTGGTFTVTNLGMYGIEGFSPIINQPETAILGICSIIDTPVVKGKEIEIKPLMKLYLTADHRVIDGAIAAEFMQDLKKYLENPVVMLV